MSWQEQKDVGILPPSRGEHLLLMEGSSPLLASLLFGARANYNEARHFE